MTNKQVLVTTTSSLEGVEVAQYLKPISAHIVAGTNIFSDFLGSITDVLGGRSHSYRKQLESLYDEAIENLKVAALKMGANCILGLKIDMDEISGKGKSMFMINAIGTAVILRETSSKAISSNENAESISKDKIKNFQKRKEIIKNANAGILELNEEVWNFITENHVHEIFDYLLSQLKKAYDSNDIGDNSNKLYKRTTFFIDNLSEEKKQEILYSKARTVQGETLCNIICSIIKDLDLLDLDKVAALLRDENFEARKAGLKISTFDKPVYNIADIGKFQNIINVINESFNERGTRIMKKQLLSSKEKEMWNCECGKTNDMESYCSNCNKDIYGFKSNDIGPKATISKIEEKIDLITGCIS